MERAAEEMRSHDDGRALVSNAFHPAAGEQPVLQVNPDETELASKLAERPTGLP